MNQIDPNLKKSYKFQYKISRHENMRIFKHPDLVKPRDLLSISAGIFELEKLLKKHSINNIKIERFVQSNNDELKNILNELIAYVLLAYIDVDFFMSKRKFYKKKDIMPKKRKTKAIVLFSGGVDSFAGIFWAKRFFNDIEGVFCAHSDQNWAVHIVNDLSKKILSPNNIRIKTINVPSITKTGYSQLRGFLYILSTAALMDLLGCDTLIISECGPTMYQPRFGPYDYVTMTTHPFIVETAQKVIELLLNRKIVILTPFENLTKSEVMSLSPFKQHFKKTHSCVSQRFGKHDGTCYGCIIRRLGAITAGIEDVDYSKNPFVDLKTENENLLSVLEFSNNILTNYGNMPFYETENIETYRKKNLFERFALDNLSAIYLLKKKKYPLIKGIERIYSDCENVVGSKRFEERIQLVRRNKFMLNLNPVRYRD